MATLAEINDTLLDQNLSLKEMVIEQEATNDAIQSLVSKISDQMEREERQRLKDSAKKVISPQRIQTGNMMQRMRESYNEAPTGIFDGLLRGLGLGGVAGGALGIGAFVSGLLSKVLGFIGTGIGRFIKIGALVGAVSLFGEDVINAIFGEGLSDEQKSDLKKALYATATWVGLGGKLLTGLLAGVVSFLFPETASATGGILVDGFKSALDGLGFNTDWIDTAMGEHAGIIEQTLGALAIAMVGRAVLLFGGKKILGLLTTRIMTGVGLTAAITAALDKLKLPFTGSGPTPPKVPDVDFQDPTSAPRPSPAKQGPNLPRTTPGGKPLTQAAETAGDIAKGTVTGRLDTKGMSKAQLRSAYGKSYKGVVKEGNRLAQQASELAKTGTDDALKGATKAAGNKWTKGMNGQLMKNGSPAELTDLIDDIQISKAAKYAKYAKFFKFVAKAAPFVGVAADMIDPVLAIYTDQPEEVILQQTAGALGSLTGATGGFILGAALTAPTGPGAVLGGILGAIGGSIAGEHSAEAIAGYLLGMNPNPIPKVDRLGIRDSMGIIDNRFSPGGQAAETFIPYGTAATKTGGMDTQLLGSDPFGDGNSFTNPAKYAAKPITSPATRSSTTPGSTPLPATRSSTTPGSTPLPATRSSATSNPNRVTPVAKKDGRSLFARWFGFGEDPTVSTPSTPGAEKATAIVGELTAVVSPTNINNLSSYTQSSSSSPRISRQTTSAKEITQYLMQQDYQAQAPVSVTNGGGTTIVDQSQNVQRAGDSYAIASGGVRNGVDRTDGGFSTGRRGGSLKQ